MKTTTAAIAAILLCAGPAFAQTTGGGTTGQGGQTGAQQKMSSAECQQVWNKANPSAKPSISQSDAQQYVIDFKKADANGDGMLSSAEFTTACGQGHVRSAAATGATGATGAGAGTSGQGAGSGAGQSPSGQQPSR